MRNSPTDLRKLDELFNGQWGKLMESLVEGDLVKLLVIYGARTSAASQWTTR